jgi:mono/diheme cytochrome c family protein
MRLVNPSQFTVRNFRVAALVVVAIGAAWTGWLHVRPFSPRDRVDFSRDIRPIFNQNCTACHGGVRQKNGVSFIYRAEALGKGKSGRPIIVAGDPDASELMVRVTSKDPETRMPYRAPPLSPQQIALLRRWIKEGAQWEDHWAFVAPKPQPLPAVKRADWVRRPLDRFILARLEKESLEPSPEADKAELLRRVSFDLTGLPPTAEEEAAYLADSSPNAYEKQVDRLLASPSYGERWASMWLDLARYADSQGYEKDSGRPGVWPYRDWVIDAFNRNLPYDKFVITQLAGDLLPNSTFEDQIATSFHRQTPNNAEGGTDDEEFRLIAVMDRSATTWSVLNGITMNCVQCHSHPYDPIRHVEYYRSLAFFNTQGDADQDDDSPNLRVPKDKARYAEASQIQQ